MADGSGNLWNQDLTNSWDPLTGVTVLSRDPIVSEEGFGGEKVTFCNSANPFSNNGTPDLNTPITSSVSSFNSWAEMTYETLDGEQVHLEKGDKVKILDSDGQVIETGDAYSLRDNSIWVASENGGGMFSTGSHQIKKISSSPKPA